MTQKDRSEVRIMLQDILAGYQREQALRDEAAAKRETLINIALNNIDSHLDKLNGKVAEHEKVINIHLPHTVQHCPQTSVIKKLEESQITWKGARNAIIVSITSTAAIVGIIWTLYKIFIDTTP